MKSFFAHLLLVFSLVFLSLSDAEPLAKEAAKHSAQVKSYTSKIDKHQNSSISDTNKSNSIESDQSDDSNLLPSDELKEGEELEAPPIPPITVINDPFEGYNRKIFAFNEKFDQYFLKPIATLYNCILPKPINQGIHNFFLNLGGFTTVANDVLQFKPYQTLNDLSRLLVNSTIGVGGLFDVATRLHIAFYQNDFGLTLARFGYKNSNYFILPFLGAFTVRDGILGLPVDYFLLSPYVFLHDRAVRLGLLGLYFIDYRAQALHFQSMIEEVAIDKYIFVRNAYLQHRSAKIDENLTLGGFDRPKGNQINQYQHD